MGQYYKIVNIDKREYFESNYGVKLMEWSYIGNDAINNLENKLANEWKGDRVYVLGDYALSSDRTDEYDFKILKDLEKELDIYGKTELYMGREYPYTIYSSLENLKFKKLELDENLKNDYRYIYNHNKKEYIDLKHTPLEWTYKEKGRIGYTSISPLSLSLALGNGMGGGDYRGNNMEYIGKYADDVKSLEITKEKINNDYKEFRPEFTEKLEGSYIPYEDIPKTLNHIKEIDSIKTSIVKKEVSLLKEYAPEFLKSRYNSQKNAQETFERMVKYSKNEIKELNEKMIDNKGLDRDEKSNDVIQKIDEISKDIDFLILKESLNKYLNETSENLDDFREDEIAEYGGSYSWTNMYQDLFKEIGINNIQNAYTESESDGKFITTIEFDGGNKLDIESASFFDINHIIENVMNVREQAINEPILVNYAEGVFKIPKELQDQGLFYYDLRDSDKEYSVEKDVLVNHIGTLVTDKEILKNRENLMYYKEIFDNKKFIMNECNPMKERLNDAEDIILADRKARNSEREDSIKTINEIYLKRLLKVYELNKDAFIDEEKGEFICIYEDGVTAVDNKDGNLYLEDFKSYDRAKCWLNKEEITDFDSDVKKSIWQGFSNTLDSKEYYTANELINNYIKKVKISNYKNNIDAEIDDSSIKVFLKEEIGNKLHLPLNREWGREGLSSQSIQILQNDKSDEKAEENEE